MELSIILPILGFIIIFSGFYSLFCAAKYINCEQSLTFIEFFGTFYFLVLIGFSFTVIIYTVTMELFKFL